MEDQLLWTGVFKDRPARIVVRYMDPPASPQASSLVNYLSALHGTRTRLQKVPTVVVEAKVWDAWDTNLSRERINGILIQAFTELNFALHEFKQNKFQALEDLYNKPSNEK